MQASITRCFVLLFFLCCLILKFMSFPCAHYIGRLKNIRSPDFFVHLPQVPEVQLKHIHHVISCRYHVYLKLCSDSDSATPVSHHVMTESKKHKNFKSKSSPCLTWFSSTTGGWPRSPALRSPT